MPLDIDAATSSTLPRESVTELTVESARRMQRVVLLAYETGLMTGREARTVLMALGLDRHIHDDDRGTAA